MNNQLFNFGHCKCHQQSNRQTWRGTEREREREREGKVDAEKKHTSYFDDKVKTSKGSKLVLGLFNVVDTCSEKEREEEREREREAKKKKKIIKAPNATSPLPSGAVGGGSAVLPAVRPLWHPLAVDWCFFAPLCPSHGWCELIKWRKLKVTTAYGLQLSVNWKKKHLSSLHVISIKLFAKNILRYLNCQATSLKHQL